MTEVHQFGSHDDPDVESDEKFDPESILDEFREEMSSGPEEEVTKDYPVPNRPNISVEYAPSIDYDLLKMWGKKATDRKKKDFDLLRYAYMILTHTCRGIQMHGRDVPTNDGAPMTFVHEEFRSMVSAANAQEAIRKLYGSHGHIIATSQKILEDAGYSEDDIEEGFGPLDRQQ